MNIPPLPIHTHSLQQSIIQCDPLDPHSPVRSHGREGHKRIGVEPALVIGLFQLCESGSVAMEESIVHLLELDEDVGEESFLSKETQVLAGLLVMVSDQVVDRCRWVWVCCVNSTS